MVKLREWAASENLRLIVYGLKCKELIKKLSIVLMLYSMEEISCRYVRMWIFCLLKNSILNQPSLWRVQIAVWLLLIEFKVLRLQDFNVSILSRQSLRRAQIAVRLVHKRGRSVQTCKWHLNGGTSLGCWLSFRSLDSKLTSQKNFKPIKHLCLLREQIAARLHYGAAVKWSQKCPSLTNYFSMDFDQGVPKYCT